MRSRHLIASLFAAAAFLMSAPPPASAHNLLLVAGNPQIVIFKISGGDVVVTKVLADKDSGEMNAIAPAAGK